MKISTSNCEIIITDDTGSILNDILQHLSYDKLFILVDENTKDHCFPKLLNINKVDLSNIIEIKSGENNKSLNSLEQIWGFLNKNGATRSSLLVNVGGGVICDMGGFAASVFKRGMQYINIPTTLLAQVDASVGGKTGVNFLGFKNEIGVFSDPSFVIIDSSFTNTLDKKHILSGWGEIIKHALIYSKENWESIKRIDPLHLDTHQLNKIIAHSIEIKNHFVNQDPRETGVRKALNLGHTIGHAFESFFMDRENALLHGEAIALGLIAELYLSNKILGFPGEDLQSVIEVIVKNYQHKEILPIQDEIIIEIMFHDKKNKNNKVNFTLLESIGKPAINQEIDNEKIKEALEYYRTQMNS